MPRGPDKQPRARRKEPAVTINGKIAYYYLHCQRCGAPKGRTNRKYCMSCRRKEPRKIELALRCPGCDQPIDRDALIVAMYYAGMPSTELGRIFQMSAQRILQIVHRHEKSVASSPLIL